MKILILSLLAFGSASAQSSDPTAPNRFGIYPVYQCDVSMGKPLKIGNSEELYWDVIEVKNVDTRSLATQTISFPLANGKNGTALIQIAQDNKDQQPNQVTTRFLFPKKKGGYNSTSKVHSNPLEKYSKQADALDVFSMTTVMPGSGKGEQLRILCGRPQSIDSMSRNPSNVEADEDLDWGDDE